MQELVIVGFAEKHRAVEVLTQLQRLQFDWSADLRNAVAVEVERDGRLRLHHSQLLDPAVGSTMHQWTAILSAIIPLPHIPQSSSKETIGEVRTINAEGDRWLRIALPDREFIRNAAAVLRPGNSAILATIREAQTALTVLSGYSYVVLRTSVEL
jgi:uncharacterized membrane protein